jgi:hypothetical protein
MAGPAGCLRQIEKSALKNNPQICLSGSGDQQLASGLRNTRKTTAHLLLLDMEQANLGHT